MINRFIGTAFVAVCSLAFAGVVGGPKTHGGPPSKNMPEVDASKLMMPATGYATPRIQPYWDTGVPNSEPGAFRTLCAPSHMAFDDPIVFPGKPGASHLHVFFGSTSTDAFSTTSSLLAAGNSTCDGGTINRTAYWVPALIDVTTGAPLVPKPILIYYKTGYGGLTGETMNLIPLGLKMIAGSAMNSVDVTATNPWAGSPYYWGCLNVAAGTDTQRAQQIPDCAAGEELWMNVTFPQCWDGVNLDSPDHKSHMSYATGTGCPATHPVGLPEISYHVKYPVLTAGATRKWRLASDMYDPALPAGRSAHADYDMAWQKDILDTVIRNCLQGKRDCHANLTGDGRLLY